MKCWNCNKKMMGNKMVLSSKGKKYTICSLTCKEFVEKYLEKERKRRRIFIWISSVLIVITLLLCLITKNEIYSNIVTLGMGSLAFVNPIPTPQTIYFFGLKKSRILIRILVIILAVGNLWLTLG